MITGAHEDAAGLDLPHPNLEIHRMGTRLTVFHRAALACWRGTGRDADIVFEVINGIAFFTPLWGFLRVPKVVLIQHVHRDQYVTELGWRGRIGALLLERLPLRHVYRRTSICAISQAARQDLIELGVSPAAVEVVYLGVDIAESPEPKASTPTLLYVGRLKRYKRPELLLDVLEAVPGAVLEVAGDGDHRAEFEAEVEQRGLLERVVMHGFVAEQDKPALYARAWLAVTASSAEGWGLTVMEAAICGTPTAALRVGGLREAIVDGETGCLADDVGDLAVRVREILASSELRDRLGAASAQRARSFSWERAAAEILVLLQQAAAAVEDHRPAPVLDLAPTGVLGVATLGDATVPVGSESQ